MYAPLQEFAVETGVLKKNRKQDGDKYSIYRSMGRRVYGTRQKKMTPTFGTLFRNAFATQLQPQIGRLLPQIGRLLPGIEGFFRRSGRLLTKSAGFEHT